MCNMMWSSSMRMNQPTNQQQRTSFRCFDAIHKHIFIASVCNIKPLCIELKTFFTVIFFPFISVSFRSFSIVLLLFFNVTCSAHIWIRSQSEHISIDDSIKHFSILWSAFSSFFFCITFVRGCSAVYFFSELCELNVDQIDYLWFRLNSQHFKSITFVNEEVNKVELYVLEYLTRILRNKIRSQAYKSQRIAS